MKNKGIDWSKKDMYEGIGRPDLKPMTTSSAKIIEGKIKCPKTMSGNHIWGSEVLDYTIISRDELQPNCILKCKACGLYNDVNLPK